MSNDENEYWRSQVEEIRSDYEHGSNYVAEEALKIIEEYIKKNQYHNRTGLLQSLSKLGNALVRVKPLMALVYSNAHRIIEFIQSIPKEERDIERIRNLTLEETSKIRQESLENFKKIQRLGTKLILDQHIILTHSASSNVEAILSEAKRLKRRFKLICTESRPRLEGVQLAKRMAKAGIKTKLIPDSDISRAIDEAHFVLTGADRITENTFINKTGTLALGILAKEYNKPFYIAADTTKILLKRTYPVRFRSVNEEEITKSTMDRLTIQNIYFEEIPLEYVHKIITAKSIFERTEFVERFL